jgi:hypothetical protein
LELKQLLKVRNDERKSLKQELSDVKYLKLSLQGLIATVANPKLLGEGATSCFSSHRDSPAYPKQ